MMHKTLLALSLLGMASAAQAAMQVQTVDYTADGVAAQGVLIWDDTVKAPRPGLLMVPDWLGINQINIDFAKQIAGKDYVVFLGDMYGKAVRPANGDAAMAAVKPLYADRARLRRRVAVAFDELRALGERHAAPIDLHRLAAIGFCFGGTSVLDLARAGTELAAVVTFHGGLSTDDPALAKRIKARVLVMNGADDPSTQADVPAFLAAMRQSPAPWQFVDFGGAVHCFSEPWANSPPGCVYNAPVARRAFALMHSWLHEAFAATPAPQVSGRD